jgi:hypothetical protein
LENLRGINWDSLNNKICEASRYFRNKKKKYVKDKVYELVMNSKKWNIRELYRGINEYKKGYQLELI